MATVDNLNPNREVGISVIIACYNSSSRLPKTLDHLFASISEYKAHQGYPIELIIVDNASTDNTKALAEEICRNACPCQYSVLTQPLKGKDKAVNLAFSKSRFKYGFIIDDDNWICLNYFEIGLDIMIRNPQIGALGGLGIPVFEIDPPEWGKDGICCGPQGEKNGDITNQRGWVLGAGCVYDMDVVDMLYSYGFQTCLGTFRGQNVDVSGEDVELCYAMRLLGSKIWYDDRLLFKHFMPAGRMVEDRYISLHRGFGVQSYVLGLYQRILKGKQKPSFFRYQTAGFEGILFSYIKTLLEYKKNIWHRSKVELLKYKLRTYLNYSYCKTQYKQFELNHKAIVNCIESINSSKI